METVLVILFWMAEIFMYGILFYIATGVLLGKGFSKVGAIITTIILSPILILIYGLFTMDIRAKDA